MNRFLSAFVCTNWLLKSKMSGGCLVEESLATSGGAVLFAAADAGGGGRDGSRDAGC